MNIYASDAAALQAKLGDRAVLSPTVGQLIERHQGKAEKKGPRYQQRSEADKFKSDREREYAKRLEQERISGNIDRWEYESIAFRLPDWGVYWPDFAVWIGDYIEFRETKGTGRFAIKDRARAKFLDARRLFPAFGWHMLQLRNGEWIEIL